jgi:prepilin-type N-terminal cleavage/methylation domain-containing protein
MICCPRLSTRNRNVALAKAGHGFTLIELSIVLTIIALLAGGVLVARDMIASAAIRKTISQYEQFNAAANTFIAKYNCLPGDCANASNFGLGLSIPWPNGSGNGIVCVNDGTTQGEIGCLRFWTHLYDAKLIASAGPANPICGYDTLQACAYNDAYYIGWHSPTASIVHQTRATLYAVNPSTSEAVGGWDVTDFETTTSPGFSRGTFPAPLPAWRAFTLRTGVGGWEPLALTPAEAYSIDAKVDDGQPLTGSAVAFALGYDGLVAPPPLNHPNDGYGVGGTHCINGSAYDTTQNMPQCDLMLRASF